MGYDENGTGLTDMEYHLHQGDCLDVLKTLSDASVDSIVTDPPYGLGFMGKKWDIGVPAVDVFVECLRVLKPGGHLLAFGGSRTYHRLAVAVEDAGFEIRDQIMWLYGCLDERTKVATESGVKPYHSAKVGERVLCYNPDTGGYSYQPILEIVEYDYSDTAYRLVGDNFEQVVSRNHRCIVERDGSEVFQLAETLEHQARVPILESLPELRKALHDAQQDTGRAQQGVQPGLLNSPDRQSEQRGEAAGVSEGAACSVRGVSSGGLEAGRLASTYSSPDVQPSMQWQTARRGVEGTRTQREGGLDVGPGGSASGPDDRGDESRLERRADLPQPEGCLCQSANKVHSLPAGIIEHGQEGRLRDGTSSRGGASDGATITENGDGSSRQPRRDGQSTGKSDAVRDERATQSVRAWRGHKTAMVRVEPIHYQGKVWCLRVPTGAFVAVRDGVAFATGNSGFPKSQNVGKAIDKAAGATREVVGTGKGRTGAAAKQWDGWGTALKPAHEPIVVARKPFKGTVAANVLEHGTGALNIDGCRVIGEKAVPASPRRAAQGAAYGDLSKDPGTGSGWDKNAGRWPANVIHDGSDEVLSGFPHTKSGTLTPDMDVKPSTGWSGGSQAGRVKSSFTANSGSAARFFYCAKASRKDRNEGCKGMPQQMPKAPNGAENAVSANRGSRSGPRENHHPTVKPTDLMAYLCRLVTPPGGTVLDPFAGSGSTGKAAMREGFTFIGIEREAEYIEIAHARIRAAGGVELGADADLDDFDLAFEPGDIAEFDLAL